MKIAYGLFQTIAAVRVDAHVAISEFVEKSLIELTRGRIQKSVVIYNPVRSVANTSKVESSDRVKARQELKVPPDAFVVGMVARIVRRKGWLDFLAALSLLADRYPIFFLIAGNGPEFKQMTIEMRARNLDRRGRALGYVEELADIYAALDCFVMASHWEGAGLSHLEAQHFSIAVVACNVLGLKETVQENVNCLMCRSNDPEDMAKKIELLITNPSLRQKIAKAGRTNAERYSTTRYAHLLNALYSQITEVRGG